MAEQGRRGAKAKVPLPRTRKTEGPRARRTRRTSSTRPLEILAIDFETADYGRDSACAFGLAHIVGGKIIETADYLIRPPRSEFAFSWLHGITWNDAAGEPDFKALWPDLKTHFAEVDFIAAHSASFDRGVLRACCSAHGLRAPAKPYLCTVKVARAAWDLYPAKLPDVCRHLAIELDHHNAASDALACAEIAVAALEDGFDVTRAVL